MAKRKTAACKNCGRGIEYFDGKDPYWAHRNPKDCVDPIPRIDRP